jgi:hypothetical protein
MGCAKMITITSLEENIEKTLKDSYELINHKEVHPGKTIKYLHQNKLNLIFIFMYKQKIKISIYEKDSLEDFSYVLKDYFSFYEDEYEKVIKKLISIKTRVNLTNIFSKK